MTILSVYIDADTERRLLQIAADTGRPIGDLAEAAVSEAALRAFQLGSDDPAKSKGSI